ncbi:MAG: hypothetical protein LBM73_00560 [Candidatus Nomurabacteria bacterium]|jgi:hypothetical protein|nr:hypothetical protein [Candidatus Nomurabacteria bacterium]
MGSLPLKSALGDIGGQVRTAVKFLEQFKTGIDSISQPAVKMSGYNRLVEAFEARAGELNKLGFAGRLVLEIDPRIVSNRALFYIMEKLRPDSVGAAWINNKSFGKTIFQVPSNINQLDSVATLPDGCAWDLRIVPFNRDSAPDAELALFGDGLPMDQYGIRWEDDKRTQTQADLLERTAIKIKRENTVVNFAVGSLRNFMTLIAMERLAGTKPDGQFCSQPVSSINLTGLGRHVGVKYGKDKTPPLLITNVSNVCDHIAIDELYGCSLSGGGVFCTIGLNNRPSS